MSSSLFKTLFLLALSTPLILASPTPAPTRASDLSSRCYQGDGTPTAPEPPKISITLCTDPEFEGECLYLDGLVADACNNLPAAFNDAITSVFNEGNPCKFFPDPDCAGIPYERAYTHIDFAMENFNDIISSYSCVLREETPVKC